MKINTPVTDQQRHMKDGTILVSKTNLKGVITYCNRDFIEISGFGESELIGRSHNLVRHPDMPPAAFQDLWETVKAGKPWSGIVKNRCKNGDFYWVHANVTPLTSNGEVVEYMSVRTMPSQAQIDAAEQLYRRVNADETTLESHSGDGRFGVFKRLKISHQLYAWAAAGVAMQAMIAMMLLSGASQTALMGVLAGGALMSALLGIWMARRTSAPLAYAATKLRQMSEGNYFDWCDVSRQDEYGQLLCAIKSTQIKLGFDVMDAREVADRATRLKSALDNVATNVMMADPENRIIYLNKTAEEMFRNAQQDIRKELPSFDAEQLVGVCIDDFHKNPAHQRGLLAALKGRFESTIKIGGRNFSIVACPVFDEHNERLGTAVEWEDRTQQVAIEEELAGLVNAARVGNLSERAAVAGKEGFTLRLSEGINSVFDTVSQVFDDIKQTMSALAQGDLTRSIEGDYQGVYAQVQSDVNDTIGNLERTVADINEATDVISHAANEIVTGNNDLSARTENQASSLEETASSMEELTSTVRNNADNAQQADLLAAGARQAAEKGGEVVGNAVAAMGEISASSGKIAEIIGVIDEIAFQTNLLALNASVEAARAGEQGRGFAVVATEVRNLAQRSATAAKEIKELIQDSVGKVNAGTELVNASGEMLDEIVTSVKKVGDIVNEIAAASAEQTSGIEMVNRAVSSMDESTQQNAALAEETSAASASMSEKASQLMQLVSVFDLADCNRKHTARATSRPAEASKPSTPPVLGAISNGATMPSRRSACSAAPTTVAAPRGTAAPTMKPTPAPLEPVDDDEWEEF